MKSVSKIKMSQKIPGKTCVVKDGNG